MVQYGAFIIVTVPSYVRLIDKSGYPLCVHACLCVCVEVYFYLSTVRILTARIFVLKGQNLYLFIFFLCCFLFGLRWRQMHFVGKVDSQAHPHTHTHIYYTIPVVVVLRNENIGYMQHWMSIVYRYKYTLASSLVFFYVIFFTSSNY